MEDQKEKYFLYILESELDHTLYIGQSNNTENRLNSHNKGQNKSTKTKVPWNLLFSKELNTRSEAVKLERKLKSWKKRSAILSWIEKQDRGVAQPG
jgi:putative endonuclease